MNSLTNTKTISAGIICKALNSYFAGNCRYKLANAFIFKDDWESDITRNEEKDWELFKIPEEDVAKYEFDGHTSKDVINRLLALYQH